MRKYIFLFIVIFSIQNLLAQNAKEFDAAYEIAIKQYKAGDFDKASILFSALIDNNSKNKHYVEAQYFKAMCLFKQKSTTDAMQLFLKLMNNHPEWERVEDVYYILGNIAFENHDYYGAMDLLSSCKSKIIYSDAFQMKKHYLLMENSIEVLKSIQQKFPDDEALAIVLASKLTNKKIISNEENMLLSYLMQTFVFDKDLKKRIEALEKQSKKEVYYVAVLFPFQWDNLSQYNVKNQNQFVIDLYNGIQMGIQKMNSSQKKIELLVYDTKNDEKEINRIIALPEFRNVDLILGPIYKNENEIVSKYCNIENKIKVNPLSSFPLSSDSNNGFYFNTSAYNLGVNAAQLCFDSIAKKNIFIAAYQNDKDSMFVDGFQTKFKALGGDSLKIKYFGKFEQILNSFKELKLDSNGTNAIVANNDQSKLVSNLCSYYNIGRLKIPLIINNDIIHCKQFIAESFKYNDLYSLNSSYTFENKTIEFKNEFMLNFGYPASQNAIIGYEMAIFYSNQLIQFGSYFNTSLKTNINNIDGELYPYFNFYNSNSNNFIPVLKMNEYKMIPYNFTISKNEFNK